MTEIATNASDYVMGHNDRVGSGMRIVDFGCGVGDVSMIAAHLIGASGQVTGIDIDETALSIARQRALEYELPNITFLQTNAGGLERSGRRLARAWLLGGLVARWKFKWGWMRRLPGAHLDETRVD